MNGRALTPEQKREVVERILAAWLRVPELRLGQFMAGAIYPEDLFFTEDARLTERCEATARLLGTEVKP